MVNMYLFEGPDEYFESFITENEYQYSRRLYFREILKFIDKVSLDKVVKEFKTSNEQDDFLLIVKTEDFFSINDHCTERLIYQFLDWIEKDYIYTVVIQNAPKVFLNSVKNLETDENIDIVKENFILSPITKKHLTKIAVNLKTNIIGQDQIISQIIAALYLNIRRKENLPVVLMFYGPPGVGKTESSNIISKAINNTYPFRQQLSMFKTNDFVDYIFGSKIQNKSLSKDLKRNKSNVILFDEFKQCPEYLYSAFFQMFDEGFYDDLNYSVSLKNTIIICTANFDNINEIEKSLGPALFSRFTHFVKFNSLDVESKKKLLSINYKEILKSLSKQDRNIIEELNIEEELLKSANEFSNVRNIKNGLKMYISKILAGKLLEEIIDESK